jgi:putative ABC transport system ATP-binding protein
MKQSPIFVNQLSDSGVDRPAGESADGLLCLKNLSKSYTEGGRSRPVLQDVSLCFAPGEFIAVLGKSGSGKTTLLNLVSGIDPPDAGEILFAGQNLTALSENERTLFRRRRIGFIFQFFYLIPTLTVLENVLLPAELNGMGQAGAARARELLEAVGLADRQRAYPDRLSGGEQQRVAIARALVHDPDLILADEPTGNLDEDTGRQVLDLLVSLGRQKNKTMLLVTHSPDAARIADRVLQMRAGHLAPVSASLL